MHGGGAATASSSRAARRATRRIRSSIRTATAPTSMPPRKTSATAECTSREREASGPLFLAAVVGHVGHARDLAVLVHADVLVVDRVVVVRQRVDHHLRQHTVALVQDADALRVDDLDRRLGALL